MHHLSDHHAFIAPLFKQQRVKFTIQLRLPQVLSPWKTTDRTEERLVGRADAIA